MFLIIRWPCNWHSTGILLFMYEYWQVKFGQFFHFSCRGAASKCNLACDHCFSCQAQQAVNFFHVLLMKIYASCICFCACSLGYWTLRRSCKRERQAEVLARGLATYVYATCNRKSRAITCPALPLVALVCKIFAKSCTVCRAGETDAEHVLIGCSSVPAY